MLHLFPGQFQVAARGCMRRVGLQCGLELREGTLDGVWGMIAATGAPLLKTRALRAAKALRQSTHAA